jgi:lipid A ethanolaminephosphotransferase
MLVRLFSKLSYLPRPRLSAVQLGWLVTLLLGLFYNGSLWHLILSLQYADAVHKWFFAAGFLLFLLAVIQLFLGLLCWPRLIKPVAVFLLLSTAQVGYFMDSYGIVIDKTMVQNLFETDPAEVRDLVTGAMLLNLLLKGVLPSLLLLWIRIKPQPVKRILVGQTISLLSCLLLIGLNAALLYKDYSSLFRNHREIRNLALPSSYLYYTGRYLSGAYDASRQVFQPLGLDARLESARLQTVSAARQKPDLLILVLGETARSMNFGLNGYARDTTPELERLPVVSFTNVESCGTSTAVSVPCMFSLQQRERYDDEQVAYQSNVLDILQHAGVSVRWRENNSGCKGVCARIPVIEAEQLNPGHDCTEEECFDDQLLFGLQQQLEGLKGPAVIVLHQKGSHGPAYFERVPENYQYFTPVCQSSELQTCVQTDIVNAYDNTIRYTDHLLAQLIEQLQQQERFNTAMLYISDHGESLGENNLYLHGMPWLLAPEEQKQVPLITWLSPGFQQTHNIDWQCLKENRDKPLSHDFLAHSLLGLMQVSTSVYQPELDLFAPCRNTRNSLVVSPLQSADKVDG